MKIKKIICRTFPLQSKIRNAVIDFSQMTVSVVAVHTDKIKNGKPIIGYGFNSNGRYSQEGIITERIIPRLMNASELELTDENSGYLDPFKVNFKMMEYEKPGGHGDRSVAIGTIDMAIWDILAKLEDKPLFMLLGERFNENKFTNEVYVYAAGGYYYPGKNYAKLMDEIKRYIDLGFESSKIKVGGAPFEEDYKRIESALNFLGSGEHLAVDANGIFSLPQALRFLEGIEKYNLKWYEEPVDPLDFLSLSAVAENSNTSIATGENIFSKADTRNLILYGGLNPNRDLLQMDPVLSYGLVEYFKILDELKFRGWSASRCIPHGGHQFGLHIAAGLGLYGMESYPEVFYPFGKFSPDMKIENGIVKLPEAPGIGYELVPEIFKILNELN